MPETPRAADASVESDETQPESSRDWEKLYGERYYLTDYTVPYGRNEHWLQFFGQVADHVVRDLSPQTTLDAGCAMGLLVEQFVNRGVDAYGIDISNFAISHAPESVRERLSVGSLTKPFARHFDLITCIEVIEHLPPEDGRAAIGNLCAATDRVLFASVPDGYEEPTHVNVQPPEAWSAWFAQHDFFRAFDYDASYLAPWAVLYERRVATLPEVVRTYDRVVARYRTEVQQVRTAVLRLSEQLEEVSAGSPPLMAQLASERDASKASEAAMYEQLLTLRDTIIGLEVEIGEARGQRDYYAAQLAGKEQIALELQSVLASRGWRATQKAMGPLRRLRRFLGH
jgi:hypothetical protein